MIRRIRRLFQKPRAEQDLDQELRFHLERQIADYVDSGISPEEARRRARLDLGGLERVKDEVRDTRWETHLDNLARDLRYALRTLRKDRRVALIAIFAIALGTGATSILFSAIYNGLLRPFPYREANRLATFYIHDVQDANMQAAGRGDRGGFTSAELLNLRAQTKSFEDMIGFMNDEMSCTNAQGTFQLHAAFVTPNTFQFLGVEPLIGRSIIPDDAEPTSPPVFGMNYRLWQKRFNADPKIVGTSFVVGGTPRTLVAIMPPRFQIDPEGSDIWIPSKPNASDSGIGKSAAEPMHLWWLLGRLRPGLNLQAAASDLNVSARRLAIALPSLYPPQFTVITRPFVDAVVGNFRDTLYTLASAAAMLLFITCTNVASLLLARGTTREKEIAIRTSIGASRGRLIQQLLLESFVLAAGGAALGCLFAYWGLKGFLAVLPAGTLPEEAAITLNPAVLLFALAAAMLTALLCGLVSAIHALRGELHSRLAGSSKRAGGDIQGKKLRDALVIAEVAMAIVLLIGAGLLTRTLSALTHVDLGFTPSNLLVTELSFPNGAYRTANEKKLFFQEVLRSVTSSPGIIAAATTVSLPPYGGPGSDVEIEGQSHSEPWSVLMDLCSDGFFRTLGLHLLHGRLLSESDIASSQRVVVVDESFAHSFFSGGDPLGQKVKFKVLELIPDAPHDAYFEIVGVVSSARNRGLRELPIPQAYLPYTMFGTRGGNILVRTAGDPLLMAKQVHNAVRSVNGNVSLTDTTSLETYLQRFDYAAPEFGLATLGTFAGIALLLAIVGIFGVMAYAVSIRAHEIGIRVALGAQRGEILRMILLNGARLVAAGILIGLFASYALTRFLANQIWGVSTTDPWTFAAVAMLAVFAGLAACLLPARRATRVDPLVALRYE